MPLIGTRGAASAQGFGLFTGNPTDPYFNYVTMLLPGNGTNGAQNNTFLDSSTNNFTITRNGNTTQGTFTPYGSNWSNYFDGTGDYLATPSSAAFGFGTGDFTIEAFANLSEGKVFGLPDGTGDALICYQVFPSGQIVVYYPVIGNFFSVSGLNNTWTHIAVTRSSGTLRVFFNGVISGSPTADSMSWPTGSFEIGRGTSISPTSPANGYISNVRVVKGTAVYTANFTPPTAPLTAITNTSLLTCQSNRFIDNSTNNFTITRNGDVSVQRFNPFGASTAYSTSVIGGSGYFDGTGDYLSVASNAAFGYGTGDFTIECWFNINSIPGGSNGYFLIDQRTTGSQAAICAYVYSDATLVLIVNGGTVITGGTVIPNQWNHFALARSGTTTKMFLNGVQVGSNYTDTNNYASLPVIIAARFQFDAGQFFPGYISNFRVVKGTALYTTTFTPPATPLTAITNTSLLLNDTNAGIIDNAMMNDLETVGNAQISTSVSKFGGGSMAFDGTDDRLTAPASPNLAFNIGNFTVEGWIYTGSTGNLGVFQISGTAGGLQANQTNNTAVYCNNLVLGAYYGGTYKDGTTPIVANTWTHFALVRSSSVTRLYVNGVLDSGFGSNSDTQNYTGQNICVGGYYGTSNLFNGYIDDLRITNGYARYTANFTPPTQAFPPF